MAPSHNGEHGLARTLNLGGAWISGTEYLIRLFGKSWFSPLAPLLLYFDIFGEGQRASVEDGVG